VKNGKKDNSNGLEREDEVYFHFSELDSSFDPNTLQIGMELEFSVVKNSWFKKMLAIRIKVLPKGTLAFPKVERLRGIVERELRGRKSDSTSVPGKISFRDERGTVTSFDFDTTDLDDKRQIPRRGDRVDFSIVEDPKTRHKKI